jgi:Tfp pilus assembly protein PilF
MKLSQLSNSFFMTMKNRKFFVLSTFLALSITVIVTFNIYLKDYRSDENNQSTSMGLFTPKDDDIVFTIKSATITDKNYADEKKYTTDKNHTIEKNKAEQGISNASWEQTIVIINDHLADFQSTSLLSYINQAETHLNNWLKNNPPHYETYLYQARIAQMQHAFDAATDALDKAIAMSPEKPEAYLLKAYIKLNTGKPLEAIPYCKKAIQASALLSLSCLSTAQARIGQEEVAYEQLQKALTHFSNLTDLEKSEAHYSLAEISLQKNVAFTNHFEKALHYQPDNINIRIRYIDALIDQKEYILSEALIKNHLQHPAIKTRKLYIDQVMGNKTTENKTMKENNLQISYQEMREYFETQSLIDKNYSSREQAFFYLYIDNNPQLALKSAYQNWKNHPEPEDALMALKSAAMIEDHEKIAEIMQWKNNLGYQDARFNQIMNGELSEKVNKI